MIPRTLVTTAPPWISSIVLNYDELARLIWALRTTEELNVLVAAVRGRKMATRQACFDEVAAALQFPHYFGENWNALLDCVRDLDWLRADAFVVVVVDAEDALTAADADEFELMLKILAMAGREWSESGELRAAKPFHTLLHTSPERADRLHERVSTLSSLTILPL